MIKIDIKMEEEEIILKEIEILPLLTWYKITNTEWATLQFMLITSSEDDDLWFGFHWKPTRIGRDSSKEALGDS